MSDKASDKRYKITLTEKQLDLIWKAVKLNAQKPEAKLSPA